MVDSMIRVNAYEYMLHDRTRRQAKKPEKKCAHGFDAALEEETKKLERRIDMEKTVKVALTVPEIRMIQEMMDEKSNEYEYSWQRNIAESIEKKVSEVCPKPLMSKWDFDKAVQKEYDKWPDKETAEGMAHAEAVRLRFMSNVSKDAG